MKLVILGDSVMWGQGLLHEHKLSTIIASRMAGHGVPRQVDMKAHSGAIIGITDNSVHSTLGGEVPSPYPSIIREVDAYTDAPEDVEMVILNGGINDVNIRCILNPLYPHILLDARIRSHCGPDMVTLLITVAKKFPNAASYVVGYYPILSYQSDPLGVEALFAVHHGVQFSPIVNRELLRNNIVDHCLRFWKLSTDCLRSAVQAANSTIGRAQFTFVETGFDESNAVFAPNAYLWPVDISPLNGFEAVDEMKQIRCQECEAAHENAIDQFVCHRASAGHPNVAGAAQIATQVLTAMRGAAAGAGA